MLNNNKYFCQSTQFKQPMYLQYLILKPTNSVSDLICTNILDLSTFTTGIKCASSNDIISVLLAKSSYKYRIQSNSLPILSLPVEHAIYRLREGYSHIDKFKISLGSLLPGHEILPFIKGHFGIRKQLMRIEVSFSF